MWFSRTFTPLIIILRICIVSCKQVNVLLFILDDLRPTLKTYGDKNAFTPNIDAIAQNGLIFNSSYAQQALCAPSRNSFLTSRRPDTLHLYDFYNYWRTFAGNFTTLPQFFKENGYQTMSVGKVFHPGVSSNFSDDQPYSWSYTPFHPSTEEYKNAKVCYSKKHSYPQKNLVCPVVTSIQPGRTLPDIESKDKAIEFICNHNSSGKPFFLAVGFHKPHIPLKYPVKFKKYHPLKNVVLPLFRRKPSNLPNVVWNPWTDIRERDDIKELNVSFPFGTIRDKEAKLILQSYYASVSYVDHLIGEILESLKKQNLDKNTIITLIGDHGWSLGEHGEWSKYSNFDVATRVPFIFNIPGLTDSKQNGKEGKTMVISEPVELLDLFPTLVDLTGLKSMKKCDSSEKEILCTEGKSLVPLIMDVFHSKNKKRKLWNIFAFSQYPRPGLYPTQHPNSDKPKLEEITVMGCSLRTTRFRYTEWLAFQNLSINWNQVYASELYDHEMDPYESINFVTNKSYLTIRSLLRNILRSNWRL